MTNRVKIVGMALAVILLIAATGYVFMTPYNRIAGVRIGGTLTSPPSDWNSVTGRGIGQLKTGGFPPFVINIAYATDEGGIITATRPDGGYWAKRARVAPNGYVRLNDETFALQATEILGEARIPYLRLYGGPDADLDFQQSGGVIVGTAEPLRDWEVFYWAPR